MDGHRQADAPRRFSGGGHRVPAGPGPVGHAGPVGSRRGRGVGADADEWGGVGVALADGDSGDFDGIEDFGSGGALAGGLGLEGRSGSGAGSNPAFGLDESGEVFVEPLSHPGSLVSAWSAASGVAGVGVGLARRGRGPRPRALVRRASRSGGGVGSDEAEQLGRFRILGVLGQGEHATVYRASDAVLERDVALKVPRPGVLRTARALERFLGEARRRRGCGIRGSSRSTRRAAPATGTTSPWR